MAMGEENPFRKMKISSLEPLRRIETRSICEMCGKSRKYYCYSCYRIINLRSCDVPTLQLPVRIDIIKHKLESDSKSTAIQAKILAPDFVNIYEFPTIPDYSTERVVLVYPDKNSYTCEMLANKLKEGADFTPSGGQWKCLDALVFIDSTWQQTHQMLENDKIKQLESVRVSDVETCFWRSQNKSKFHLSTIEAIYYFLKEMNSKLTLEKYDAQFDDLFYFFSFQYETVHKAMEEKGEA